MKKTSNSKTINLTIVWFSSMISFSIEIFVGIVCFLTNNLKFVAVNFFYFKFFSFLAFSPSPNNMQIGQLTTTITTSVPGFKFFFISILFFLVLNFVLP